MRKRRKDFKNRTGEKCITKQGYEVEIIEYFDAQNSTVRFSNGVILYNIRYRNIISIENPYHPTLCGVGYLGEGKYSSRLNGIKTNYYSAWASMIGRSYDEKTQKIHPTYIGCSVDERWHNFQNYAKWYEENLRDGFEVDKDILFKGNKIYSPKTCCFVPTEINNLFVKSNKQRIDLPIGVVKSGKKFRAIIRKGVDNIDLGTYKFIQEAFNAYKIAKEFWIKEVADEWKDRIELDVYEAMYNWTIEITD
jgi:hypothetical protein